MKVAPEFWSGRRVLITGGLGFIGSNLAIRLVGLGSRVMIVDSLIPAYGGNRFNIEPVKDQVRINIADVRDQNSMDVLVQDQDIIFNLAGQVSHTDSMEDPYTDLEINCRSQLGILEACKKNNRKVKILYAGTRGQYGKPEKLPVDETHLMQPTDVNGINKMAGEWYHILYNNVYGIRACSLRLTNTYGPRHQMKNSRQGIVNWFVRLAIEDQTIPVFGSGTQLRDCNYVDDVVEAFLLAAASEETNGQVFNLGSGDPRSLLELVKLIIKLAGSGKLKMKEFPAASEAIEIGSYQADFSRFKNTIGWQPKINIEEGLAKTIRYYRQNREYYF